MKRIILICTLLISAVTFSQGPPITLHNDLANCQVEYELYQINTTTLDCTSLIVSTHALGVLTYGYVVNPLPGHAFVKAKVRKGGGTPSCFIAVVEPDDSPCNSVAIPEYIHFDQCCSSSISGGMSVKWTGGMADPNIVTQND